MYYITKLIIPNGICLKDSEQASSFKCLSTLKIEWEILSCERYFPRDFKTSGNFRKNPLIFLCGGILCSSVCENKLGLENWIKKLQCAMREKVPQVLSRCDTKRRNGCASYPSLGITPTCKRKLKRKNGGKKNKKQPGLLYHKKKIKHMKKRKKKGKKKSKKCHTKKDRRVVPT